MRKIPTIFIRETDERGRPCPLVTREPNPAVPDLAGAVATVKWDGTACLVRDGRLFRRYDAKHGKTPPDGFLPAQDAPDPITGKLPGWLPVGDGPDDQYHRRAFDSLLRSSDNTGDGTYELVGAKVQGNPYSFSPDVAALVPHGTEWVLNLPTLGYDDLRDWLAAHAVEGLVWWLDGEPVAKIKRRDFGLPWPIGKAGG